MKQILMKIAVLLLILIVIDRLFGLLFTNLIFKKTISGERGGAINYILQKDRDIHFLILGSSRAKHQIDPRLLTHLKGKGYNAGENAVGGVLYSSILLDLLLKHQIKPQTVILQLDAYYFDESRKKQNNLELRALYPFYQESQLLHAYVKETGWKEAALIHSDMFKYNFKVYRLMFNYINEKKMINPYGFVPLTAKMDTSKISYVSMPQTNKPVKLDNLKLKALKHIMNLCTDYNISLYIVFPPNFRNFTNQKFYNDKLKAFVASAKSQARVIDMSDITALPDLQHPDNWKDEAHMNITGAERFSNNLNDSLYKYSTTKPLSNY